MSPHLGFAECHLAFCFMLLCVFVYVKDHKAHNSEYVLYFENISRFFNCKHKRI